MGSFEELGLGAELVEALLAEGIEEPSPLQSDAIPVLLRGNPAVLRAGPGAGAMVAYGTALLDRLDSGEGQPVAVVLVPTRDVAAQVARSMGRLAMGSALRCAGLDSAFALPGHADILVATPSDLERAIRSAEVKLDRVRALVLDGAGPLLEGTDRTGIILEALDSTELQGIVVADPITPTVRQWVDEHLRRAVFLPAEATGEDRAQAPVERGVLGLQLVKESAPHRQVVSTVARLLEEPVHHVLLFFRSEDRAADAADLLGLHGYLAGSPGDPTTPVWLGLDPLADRQDVEASTIDPDRVATVSLDPPLEVDILDRRHGGRTGRHVCVATPREIPHLRRIAREAGYRLEELPEPSPPPAGEVETFRDELEQTLEAEDLGAYMALLDPLLERWTGAEVAAALAALLRRGGARGGTGAAAPQADTGRPPAWTRLFLSVGSRDGAGPGDLLGAITGEVGLQGDQVGRIDVKDTYTRVEVQAAFAPQVIEALNGTTIKGRSVRVDYDRGGTPGGKGR